jgi:trk system potassium uptake protein TrkA
MKVIIMGCGRVGRQVSRMMADEGHEVTVVDKNEEPLARLGPDFRGHKVKGIGFDQDVLLAAGIETAEAFAATSSSDNVNIIAARIAHNIFRVPRVVARLYDPRHAEIYRRLGLITIASTVWGAERIRELITYADLDATLTFGGGEVSLITVETPPALVGRFVRQLNLPGEISVITLTRDGAALIPTSGTEFRAGDTIHLAVLATAMERLQALLG